jgi:hypothetical protein
MRINDHRQLSDNMRKFGLNPAILRVTWRSFVTAGRLTEASPLVSSD